MKEFNWRWTNGRMRKRLCIRLWWRNPLPGIWRWLTRQAYCTDRPSGYFRSLHYHQDRCYCPQGLLTDFRFEAFGVGVFGWLSRQWMVTPCPCDKIMWLLFPDGHEDEIEEYGLKRLQAEFPGVVPV